MSDLSVEAQVVIGGFFSILITTELSFKRPWVIHPKMRKGLDDLVDAGYLTVEKFNKHSGTMIWRPTEKLKSENPKVSRAFMEQHSFPVMDETQPKPKKALK